MLEIDMCLKLFQRTSDWPGDTKRDVFTIHLFGNPRQVKVISDGIWKAICKQMDSQHNDFKIYIYYSKRKTFQSRISNKFKQKCKFQWLYSILCIEGAVNKNLVYHAIGEAKTVVSLVMLVKIGAGKVGIF